MVELSEGPVQRGNGKGGPTTLKPVILPKGQASARAALAEQQGKGPSESDVAELFYRYMGAGPEAGFENAIAEALSRWGHQPARLRNCPTHGQQPPEAWGCPECVRELREELHRTVPVQPTPPAEWEVAQLVAWLRAYANVEQAEGRSATGRSLTRAAELLQQHHPAPVPVSERLPGPEDCDEEGFCWWFSPSDPSAGTFGVAACWVLRKHEPEDDFRTHWLPATALLLPSGEVEA